MEMELLKVTTISEGHLLTNRASALLESRVGVLMSLRIEGRGERVSQSFAKGPILGL